MGIQRHVWKEIDHTDKSTAAVILTFCKSSQYSKLHTELALLMLDWLTGYNKVPQILPSKTSVKCTWLQTCVRP